MGVHGGPDIVEDGLIFAVDAGNGQSYVSGSTTCTNLFGPYTGSLQDDTQYSPSVSGCWDFDNVDDFINFPDDIGINGATEMSCFCWVNSDSLEVNDAIAVKWDYRGDGCFAFQTDNSTVGELRVFIADELNDIGDNFTHTTDADLASTTWYYVGFTYDGNQGASNDRIEIYVDGVKKSKAYNGTINTSLIAATATFKIAQFGGSLDREWNGKIANCQIYNKSLSAAEVLQNYNATKERFI